MGVKYSIDPFFFKNWNHRMAYVLGFIYADGGMFISSRGKYVVITNTDKSTILIIKKWLKSHHKIRKEKSEFKNRKNRYILRIGNKEIYDSLIQIGLFPNKSLTIKIPEIPEEYFRDFLRGYFDGDGCVHLYRSKGIKQKIILRRLSVIFTSGSEDFLRGLLRRIRSFVIIKQRKVYKSHKSFQIRFSTKDSIEVFKLIFGGKTKEYILKRKLNIFLEYFKLRPQRVDNNVLRILRCLS